MIINQPNQRSILAIVSIRTQPVYCRRLSAHYSRPRRVQAFRSTPGLHPITLPWNLSPSFSLLTGGGDESIQPRAHRPTSSSLSGSIPKRSERYQSLDWLGQQIQQDAPRLRCKAKPRRQEDRSRSSEH